MYYLGAIGSVTNSIALKSKAFYEAPVIGDYEWGIIDLVDQPKDGVRYD